MRVEELVGRHIGAEREAQHMTQEELGRRLGPLLGRAWSRQAVSAAEKGSRQFTAAELVAIAYALGTNVGRLLTPPVASDDISLPGASISPSDMRSAAMEYSRTENTAAAMAETIGRIVDQLATILETGSATAQTAELLWHQLHSLPVLEPVTPEQMAAWQAETERRAETRDRTMRVHLQPIAAAIVTSPHGVLIGRRNDRTPPWTFIAGEVEPGERADDAAIRETKEEAGLEIVVGERIGERVHPATGRTMIYLAAEPREGTSIFVGDRAELAEVRWASLAEAEQLMPDMFGPVHEYLIRELEEGGDDGEGA